MISITCNYSITSTIIGNVSDCRDGLGPNSEFNDGHL